MKKCLLAFIMVALLASCVAAEETDSKFALSIGQRCMDLEGTGMSLSGVYYLGDKLSLELSCDFMESFGIGFDAQYRAFEYGSGGQISFLIGPAFWLGAEYSGLSFGLQIRPIDYWKKVISKDWAIGLSILPISVMTDMGFNGLAFSISLLDLRVFL